MQSSATPAAKTGTLGKVQLHPGLQDTLERCQRCLEPKDRCDSYVSSLWSLLVDEREACRPPNPEKHSHNVTVNSEARDPMPTLQPAIEGYGEWPHEKPFSSCSNDQDAISLEDNVHELKVTFSDLAGFENLRFGRDRFDNFFSSVGELEDCVRSFNQSDGSLNPVSRRKGLIALVVSITVWITVEDRHVRPKTSCTYP